MIRARGVKVGLSIKPGTPVEAAEPYLAKIDMLLIMTVEPGFGGQKFIPASYERIPQARKMITDRNLNVDIEVDGGIKLDNVDSVLDAGANIIVAGSAVYGKDTYGCTKAFLDDFAAAVGSWANVADVINCGTHAVAVFADGTVKAVGDGTYLEPRTTQGGATDYLRKTDGIYLNVDTWKLW